MEKSQRIKRKIKTSTFVSREDHKKRLSICSACPDSRFSFGVGFTCGYFLNLFPKGGIKTEGKTCGCILAVKSRMENQNCPQSKW
jgi:hypothetical protein